jgi:two-component system response regulator
MPAHAVILIVDDDPDDRAFVADALAACGVAAPRVQLVVNGRQALDYLAGLGPYASRESHPLPCLVLLDIKMPVLDGLETLSAMRSSEAWDTIPVVMLTGSAQPSDIKRAFSLGANAFMVKPASLARLKEMMRAVVQFWLENNVTCMSDWT